MTEEEKTILRKYLPWDLPTERLEAMAWAMYERGPMFQNTGLVWDAFPDYLADRRAVYIADALAAHQGDPIMRELYKDGRDKEEYWTTKVGERIAAGDMEVDHLRNILRMLLKKRRIAINRESDGQHYQDLANPQAFFPLLDGGVYGSPELQKKYGGG